jgi:2-phosphoglycerate kinase
VVNRDQKTWKALVLYGASGTGKSTAAAAIARDCGITWMQADDLRLALQYSKATLPEHNSDLYYFTDTPGFWNRPTAELRDAFVGTAKAMAPAIRIVLGSHIATQVPIVLEGDGVLPAISEDPQIKPWVESGDIRFCCIAAESHAELLRNMIDRGRDDHLHDAERAARQSDANWTYNAWLIDESRRLGVPVVSSLPFETLTQRIVYAIEARVV